MTRTMLELKPVIEDRRRRLLEHPFFRGLEASSDVEQLRNFVPQLFFFVFGFQDMLRIAHERISDPKLREIAGRHRAEDAGHEVWFVNDAIELKCERDVVWVFGKEHHVTRDFCYELVAEILHAENDHLRLVFPLVLESAGSVFFEKVIGLIRRSGYEGRLQYFAESHQEIEQAHDMFTADGQQEIDDLVMPQAVFDTAVALVQRSFDACERFAQHLETHRGRAES